MATVGEARIKNEIVYQLLLREPRHGKDSIVGGGGGGGGGVGGGGGEPETTFIAQLESDTSPSVF